MKTIDTIVTKLLDKNKIHYKILRHEKPAYTVESAARERGVDKNVMIKSILLVNSHNEYIMACLQGDAELNSKAFRKILSKNWKRFRFATPEELFNVTGFVLGAVTPIGITNAIPVYFDEKITEIEKVNISSGDPMAGIELSSVDLIDLVKPELIKLT